MNVESFIARRYLFSRKKINFITIISFISIIGVTIGVAAMIIVLSVFNGFNAKVTSILVGFDPHVRVEAVNSNKLSDYKSLQDKIKDAGITHTSPFTLNKGMLASSKLNRVVFVKGVEEETVNEVSGVKDVMALGTFDLNDEGEYAGIVLGRSLAADLLSMEGDTITLLSPVGLEKSLTQFVEPTTRKFIVMGIFDSDNKEYDSKYAYISLKASQDLFKLEEKVNGVEMRLDNINNSESTKEKLQEALGEDYKVSTWYDLHADFYSILQVERWTAFIILSLIILVACFNILASLTMTVIEKKRDIGILKAMGSTNKMITRIFMFEGITVGLIGMIAGSLLGLGITLAQKYFHLYKLDSSIYKVDALPVELRALDFVYVPLAAFVLCFLASLYPSKKAAGLDPVESIRWE